MYTILLAHLLAILNVAKGNEHLSQSTFDISEHPLLPPKEPWLEKFGSQIDLTFTGPLSFSHMPYYRCLDGGNPDFSIAILGFPFDTAVTHRPGARFGPNGIRSGSRRQRAGRGYSLSWGNDPYTVGSTIIDCGDVPITPFDNAKAVDQMETAYTTLIARSAPGSTNYTAQLALDQQEHPRIVTLGGDHTIVLPILRSLHKLYGPISVIHFDAHLDTWASYPGQSTPQETITHGTFFAVAYSEGLMSNSSVHAGIRCKLGGLQDVEHDESVGFQLISTDDIDDIGTAGIIQKVRERVGDSPVYLTFDIDTIDPGLAPATGTPEAGGWTVREVKRIIRGLAGLNFVGADIVEVAPAYDHAEVTSIAAADLVHDFLSMMLLPPPAKSTVSGPECHHPL